VPGSSRSLWLLWGALFATLFGWLAMPWWVPHRADPWHDAQTAVAGFVLAIFALVGGWATLAVRESLVDRELREGRIDPDAPAGRAQLRLRLLALWALCAAVGSLGAPISYYSDRPETAWPYLAGAAVLFLIHAPRAGFLRRLEAE
jgi:hypothetical protein